MFALQSADASRGANDGRGVDYVGLMLALQWQAGAYRAESTFYPDEPAHQVSGLMVQRLPGAAGPRFAGIAPFRSPRNFTSLSQGGDRKLASGLLQSWCYAY